MASRLLPHTLLVITSLLPVSAMAHTGHDSASFVAGLSHPFGGLDHLLAMLAVGLWAAKIGGKALWRVPLAFVLALLVSGALGIAGVQLPLIEGGILLSVIVMGVLLAFAVRFSPIICTLLVASFALFHGAAHGAEMPLAANGVLYALGFTVATTALHLAGIALANLKAIHSGLIGRMIGAMIALTGVLMAAV